MDSASLWGLFLLTLTIVEGSVFSPTPYSLFGLPPVGSGSLQSVYRPDLCLNAYGGILSLAPCDMASRAQAFELFNFASYISSPGPIKFVTGTTGYVGVLGAGMNNGAEIGIGGVSANIGLAASQKWQLFNGVIDGTFQLKVAHSGRCLTAVVQASGTTNSRLEQWDCVGLSLLTQLQFWRVIQYPNVPPSPVMLKSVSQNTKCLANLYWVDSPVGLKPCTASGLAKQLWALVFAYTETSIFIRNKHANECLQVIGAAVGQNGGAVVGLGSCEPTCPLMPYTIPLHLIWTTASPNWPVSQMRIRFESKTGTSLCLNAGLDGSELHDCSTATEHYFNIIVPAVYMKPYGDACVGPPDCLSDSCNLICQKGVAGKPCRTKDDCISGSCPLTTAKCA